GELTEVDPQPRRCLGTAARDECGKRLVPTLDTNSTNVRRLDGVPVEGGAGGRAQPPAPRGLAARRNAGESPRRGNDPERCGFGRTKLDQAIQEEVHCKLRRKLRHVSS